MSYPSIPTAPNDYPPFFTLTPPPPTLPTRQSDPNFSPLIIALIGILASAFLLVSYYTVISKYCTKWEVLRPRRRSDQETDPFPVTEDSWPVMNNGLEESVIRSIPVFKYKAGDGFVDDTECAVCLSEFQENETLRLLPKCTHAFHVPCIDMWLSSHSNCPLCRANIVSPAVSPIQETVTEENSDSTVDSPSREASENETVRESSEEESAQEMGLEAPPSLMAISHIRAESDFIIKYGRNDSLSQSSKLHLSEIQQHQAMKRSYSVDSCQKLPVLITDLLAIHLALEDGKLKGFSSANDGGVGVSSSVDLEDGNSRTFCSVEEAQVGASSSVQSSSPALEHNMATEMSCASLKALNKQYGGDRNKSTMKRSFSGGKFFFFRNSRGRNTPILPT
ncbi:hypothetical protein SUGI_0049600 [Cryptomeria japonica]|uniref:RING-H2 finger protein ATL52 n=1 Tax=Cryptomeria japonica TaxID=3369 RepID=UPI002408C213|nr:RING-H2 finger protein ATL52 [Cryptomeria japonica]GLJ06833.1 hypothetical protein SUGI_0049600 [Cryptomeria japonica]